MVRGSLRLNPWGDHVPRRGRSGPAYLPRSIVVALAIGPLTGMFVSRRTRSAPAPVLAAAPPLLLQEVDAPAQALVTRRRRTGPSRPEEARLRILSYVAAIVDQVALGQWDGALIPPLLPRRTRSAPAQQLVVLAVVQQPEVASDDDVHLLEHEAANVPRRRRTGPSRPEEARLRILSYVAVIDEEVSLGQWDGALIPPLLPRRTRSAPALRLAAPVVAGPLQPEEGEVDVPDGADEILDVADEMIGAEGRIQHDGVDG